MLKIILLVLLAIILLIAGLLLTVTWNKWQVYVHYKDKRLFIELRGIFYKKVLVDRDFTQKEEASAEKTEPQEETKSEKNKTGIIERFKTDKDKIYTKETGYNHQGLMGVIDDYKEIIGKIKDVLEVFFEGMRYKIEIPLIRIKLDFGTGNPAHTGMLFGGIWGAVGTAYPIARRYLDVAYPVMEVTPDFNGSRFDLEFKSIIKVRPAHIINALFKREVWAAVTYFYKNFIKGSVENG